MLGMQWAVKAAAHPIRLPLLLLLLAFGCARACWPAPESWVQRVAPPWPLLDAARQMVPTEMLVQGERTWLAWLTDPYEDSCLRHAIALRLVLADGDNTTINSGGPLNVTVALANLSRAFAPQGCSNGTAAWLAAGPWCAVPPDATLSDRVHNAAALLFHALTVAGLEPAFSVALASVLLLWSILVAVIGRALCVGTIRCCACCCVRCRAHCAPNYQVVSPNTEYEQELNVRLTDDEGEDDRLGHTVSQFPAVPLQRQGTPRRGTHGRTSRAASLNGSQGIGRNQNDTGAPQSFV